MRLSSARFDVVSPNQLLLCPTDSLIGSFNDKRLFTQAANGTLVQAERIREGIAQLPMIEIMQDLLKPFLSTQIALFNNYSPLPLSPSQYSSPHTGRSAATETAPHSPSRCAVHQTLLLAQEIQDRIDSAFLIGEN